MSNESNSRAGEARTVSSSVGRALLGPGGEQGIIHQIPWWHLGLHIELADRIAPFLVYKEASIG